MKEKQMVTTQVKPVIILRIGMDKTTVTSSVHGAPDGYMVLGVGSVKTANDFFKHSPPTPLEMENAIMAVEDEVIRSRNVIPKYSVLVTTDTSIRDIALLAGVAASDRMNLSVEGVERQFDLLAALTLGRPASSAGIPTDSKFAATLLILREFMHHLQFESITIEA